MPADPGRRSGQRVHVPEDDHLTQQVGRCRRHHERGHHAREREGDGPRLRPLAPAVGPDRQPDEGGQLGHEGQQPDDPELDERLQVVVVRRLVVDQPLLDHARPDAGDRVGAGHGGDVRPLAPPPADPGLRAGDARVGRRELVDPVADVGREGGQGHEDHDERRHQAAATGHPQHDEHTHHGGRPGQSGVGQGERHAYRHEGEQRGDPDPSRAGEHDGDEDQDGDGQEVAEGVRLREGGDGPLDAVLDLRAVDPDQRAGHGDGHRDHRGGEHRAEHAIGSSGVLAQPVDDEEHEDRGRQAGQLGRAVPRRLTTERGHRGGDEEGGEGQAGGRGRMAPALQPAAAPPDQADGDEEHAEHAWPGR